MQNILYCPKCGSEKILCLDSQIIILETGIYTRATQVWCEACKKLTKILKGDFFKKGGEKNDK
jgi:Zn finger protein HypA/HybF involved in hydrogenase expression